MRSSTTSLLALAAWVCTAACQSGNTNQSLATASAPSSVVPAGPAASAQSRLTRIVFIDKENCCQCTRDRIDASWSALQAALAGRSKAIPVERVHFDTQPQLGREYHSRRPTLTFPAIYFLDGEDNIVELLQGELTQAQLSAVLERP